MKITEQNLTEIEIAQERGHAADSMLRLFSEVLVAADGSAPLWLFVRMDCAATATCGMSLRSLIEGVTGEPLMGSPWCHGSETAMVERIESHLDSMAPTVLDDPFEGEVLLGSNKVRKAAVWCHQMWAISLYSLVEDSEPPGKVLECFERYVDLLGYGTNRIEDTTALNRGHVMTTQKILASFHFHGRAHAVRRRDK